MTRWLLKTWLLAVMMGGAALAAQSSTHLYAPYCGPPTAIGDHGWQTANQLNCLDFVPCVGIDDATQLAWRTGGNSITGTPTAGFAFYNADGSSQIREATGTYSATGTMQVITGLTAFTLTAGTSYRFCWCSSGNGSFAGPAPNATIFREFTNAFVTDIGSAANSCSSGDPPATTGSLSSTAVGVPAVLLGTDTP